MKTENYSPLDPINSVFSGPPGVEASVCLTLPPEISLFEPQSREDASVFKARLDHDRMREEFETQGITSYNMREVIGTELARRRQSFFTDRETFLSELVKRAYFLYKKYNLPLDFDNLVFEIEQLFDEDVKVMGLDPAIAINGVLTNLIDTDGYYKDFDPYLPPAGNFMFWRDTNHVTANKMVTHKMFLPIRDQEVALAKIGFDSLGLKYQQASIPGIGSIEGGDVLPMEINGQLYALIGTAERTSRNAVDDWYKTHESSFSASGEGIIPLMVQGPTKDTQDQMHLDTYAQQISPESIIYCRDITSNRKISVLMRKNGQIINAKFNNLLDGTFTQWIDHNATNGYPMSVHEQLNYAPNVLVHGNGNENTTVFITRDGTPAVTKFIQENAAKTVLLHMNELTKFYGGAHCATSEIRNRR